MQSDMDNREWLNDYPSVQQVSQANPFTVPGEYFDAMHQRVMSRAAIDGVNADAGTGYTVPDNYFEDLTSHLNSRIAVEQALNTEPGFAVPENYFEQMQASLQSRIVIETAVNNTAGDFTVPEGYFEQMQASLQTRINIEAAVHNTNGDFTVPDNYFEDQLQQISSRIAVDEMLNGQPESFTVPANYFEDMQGAIMANINEPAVEEAKVLPMAKRQQPGIVRRMFTSGAFKYATAACLVLGIGGTVLMNTYYSPASVHNRSYIHKALAKVDNNDIIDYLQSHMDAADTRSVIDVADQVSNGGVSTSDIKDYLNNN